MITRVAILQNGQLFVGEEGERHHNLIPKIAKALNIRPVNGEQGFINHKGEFLNREQAAREALECGQVIDGHANIKHVFDGIRLYSEDLW